ncbi:MAG: ammonium transporter [Actinomycetota bacterium]|nr:ammonium transporter [Actinomycetota bacterium]
MGEELSALNIIFTEFYFWVTVVMMFLIHVGFAVYEVGAARRKNVQHTLIKNIMVIPLVTVTFFFFGWYIYFALPNGPGITGGIVSSATELAAPWSEAMGPNMQDRINGVFWAAFLLFSWTAASIVSGALIERVRLGAFFIFAVLLGSITWIIDAAWGWSPNGWMVQLMGYHDAYASGVIHAIAGGTALAVVIVLGPRIGKFGPNGEVRQIKPHNTWMTCIGLLLIYTGFWGFYAACNIPILDVGGDSGTFFSATNIYLMPTTLSGITFNFLMSLSGGLLAGFIVSKADPFWTLSGGLAGIIAASAGNDLYHPVQAMLIGAAGAALAFKLHYYVERRFRIDDAVGAVAVHGYAGFFGVVVAGFVLWGYPAAAPVEANAALFGSTAEGFPAINPLGNLLGAIIMFFVLGFLPAFGVAKLLNRFGLLRVPRAVELAGLDTHSHGNPYPYFQSSEAEGGFAEVERAAAATLSHHVAGRLDGAEPTGSTAREDRRALK